MRHVSRDVAANDLVDRVGNGRIFGIVMDDFNIPWDDTDIVLAARTAARHIVEGMNPSDVAAIVFPFDSGRSVDFTDDRNELMAAIDRFRPHEIPWGYADRTPNGPGPGGADMLQRTSPILMRSQCQRAQPAVPAIDVLAARLSTIPNRRKTIILVTTGVPLSYGATQGCPGALADEMKDVLRISQRSNINIYSVDPAGYRGYESYLQNPMLAARRFMPTGPVGTNAADSNTAVAAARLRHDFLEMTAEQTGARAVINTDYVETGIDQIFAEDTSYYLVGYQTSNGKPDGKFRKLQVKVNRPGATVRTRSGYYAPRQGSLVNGESKSAPATNDLGLTGMDTPAGLALRATAAPLGLTGVPGNHDSVVGVVLSVRLPPAQSAISETLVVTRNIYDEDGKAGPPSQDRIPLALKPGAGDELRYDVYYKLTMAPGRYQLRLNAHSTALDKSGTVFVDIEVPDVTRPPLSISAVTLGAPPVGETRTDVLAPLVPFVPTSERDFAPSDPLRAFVRVYEGGTTAVVPVNMSVKVLDVHDATVFEHSEIIRPEAFDAGRGASFTLDIPLGRLLHGPHLLSISGILPGGTEVRRDLVFHVR
jgi:VWFA-related protein